MQKRSVIGLAIAGLALTYAPAYAAVDDAGPGLICQFTSVVDPTAEPGTQTGAISGGPLALTDSTTGGLGSGTLVCRVQVNVTDHTGSGPVATGHGTGVVTAGPATIQYRADETDWVVLCAEFIDDWDGTTYYWDGLDDAWSTNPLVPCGINLPGPGDPEHDPINAIPCPLFAIAPSPVGELLQDTWEDCGEAGPPSTIVVESIPGTDTGILVTPPLWSCTMPTGSIVGPSGTVTCDAPPVRRTPTRTKCTSVSAEAHLSPDGASTVSYTSTCGNLSVTATAGPVMPRDQKTKAGSGNRPVTCTWATTGNPVLWGGSCDTNRG